MPEYVTLFPSPMSPGFERFAQISSTFFFLVGLNNI
jgi:hypothetical protein